ncbi:anti-sigma factor family protein [Flaviaesturariibacter terrae]
MEQAQDMEVQLWAYIDGLADATEQSRIERLLAENAAWRAKYAELLETHELLQLGELEEPSLRFTRNVMDAIAQEQIVPATRQYLNKRVIGGIGLFFGALLLTVLVYAIGQSSGSDAGSSRPGVPLPSFDISTAFSNQYVNLFLMANIVLGLFLLDRLLAARREKGLREH